MTIQPPETRHWSRRWWVRVLLVWGAVACLSPILCCSGLFFRTEYIRRYVYTDEDRTFFARDRDGYSEGVPSVARRLKAEMEPIPNPDVASQLHPEWASIQFPSGEWVFGYGVNSHGFGPGHGTLVVKDSRGQVRIFFGHVCGQNAGIEWIAQNVQTLDIFYTRLLEGDVLREWIPGP